MKTISPTAWNLTAHITVAEAVEQLRRVRHKHIAHIKMASFLVRAFGTEGEKADLLLGIVPHWARAQAEQLLDYDRTSPHAFTAGVHWRVLDKWTAKYPFACEAA
jgi:hypothetical protein